MKNDSGAVESNRITSQVGHSIKPCHKTPLYSCDSCREFAFAVILHQSSLPFSSYWFYFWWWFEKMVIKSALRAGLK